VIPERSATSPGPRSRTREQIYWRIANAPDGVTRHELADLCGISRSGVTHAVARLLADHRVIEDSGTGSGPGSGSGRPPALLRLPTRPGNLVGIDFGHQHVAVAVSDTRGRILRQRRTQHDVDHAVSRAIDVAAAMATELMGEVGASTPELTVAGIPCPINRESGAVIPPRSLTGWLDVDAVAELAARLGCPVHLANDASLGSLAELRRGAGRMHRDFVYVKISHGIGAGIVLDGKLRQGAIGIAGEIGHISVRRDGDLCRCGARGCLETVASSSALRRALASVMPPSAIETQTIGSITEPAATRVFLEAGATLGRTLCTLCDALNPAVIVLGGEVGSTVPAILQAAQQAISAHTQPATTTGVAVTTATFGQDNEVTGAIAHATILAQAAAG
jgi:predicted NBD/HSP70 family sugar kinase